MKAVLKPTNVIKNNKMSDPKAYHTNTRKTNQKEEKKRKAKQKCLSTDVFADFSWVGLSLDSDVRRFQYQ